MSRASHVLSSPASAPTPIRPTSFPARRPGRRAPPGTAGGSRSCPPVPPAALRSSAQGTSLTEIDIETLEGELRLETPRLPACKRGPLATGRREKAALATAAALPAGERLSRSPQRKPPAVKRPGVTKGRWFSVPSTVPSASRVRQFGSRKRIPSACRRPFKPKVAGSTSVGRIAWVARSAQARRRYPRDLPRWPWGSAQLLPGYVLRADRSPRLRVLSQSHPRRNPAPPNFR